MYRIAICEDEKIFATALEEYCSQTCKRLEIRYTATVFPNSEEFLQAFLINPRSFDLLLLDIVMDGLNGMDLAKKIREKNKEVTIIFVTSTPAFAIQGYEVQALHYLLKPVNLGLLEALIRSDYTDKFQKESIVLEAPGGIVKLRFADIVALETVNRKVAVYLLDQTVFHAGKLGELAGKLPPKLFVRCHQSFVVNIKHVRELNGNNAITTNKKSIPVSRSYQKVLQKAFLKQLED